MLENCTHYYKEHHDLIIWICFSHDCCFFTSSYKPSYIRNQMCFLAVDSFSVKKNVDITTTNRIKQQQINNMWNFQAVLFSQNSSNRFKSLRNTRIDGFVSTTGICRDVREYYNSANYVICVDNKVLHIIWHSKLMVRYTAFYRDAWW